MSLCSFEHRIAEIKRCQHGKCTSFYQGASRRRQVGLKACAFTAIYCKAWQRRRSCSPLVQVAAAPARKTVAEKRALRNITYMLQLHVISDASRSLASAWRFAQP